METFGCFFFKEINSHTCCNATKSVLNVPTQANVYAKQIHPAPITLCMNARMHVVWPADDTVLYGQNLLAQQLSKTVSFSWIRIIFGMWMTCGISAVPFTEYHSYRFDSPGSHGQEYLDAINGIFLKNIASECAKKDCVTESENEVIIEYSIEVFDETLTWETDESYSLTMSTSGQSHFIVWYMAVIEPFGNFGFKS